MTLSCSTTVCPQLSLVDAMEFAKNAGFGGIELFLAWTESSPVRAGLTPGIVRQRLDDAGLILTGLNIRNITGQKPGAKERGLDGNLNQIEKDIRLAGDLGLTSANTKGGARTREAQEDLIEGVNRLLERRPDLTLNLGNHHGNRLQGLADYRAVMPHVNRRAKILLDTGHLIVDRENILKIVEAFPDRIGLVHLRDQKDDTPVPFGEGDLPFEDLFRLLKQTGYQGTLVVELEHVTWGDPLDATQAAREYVQAVLDRTGD